MDGEYTSRTCKIGAVIEKDVNPHDSDKSAYLKEIHSKHSEILSNRPIPNLLDSASAASRAISRFILISTDRAGNASW